ncbi:hypothetical protein EU527_02535 [Candidatus Thorarchaeota archaeon]|nr:MAG: hypothetical protein EU527_02535 [Candidatus Thorarchaeota archaeon]
MAMRDKRKRKKEPTLQKIQDPIEWLKHDRKTNDQNILKMLITGYANWKLPKYDLDETLFERTFKLHPLSSEPVSITTLNEVLNYRKDEHILDATILETLNHLLHSSKVRDARTINEQLQSILPSERDSLTYPFSRIISDEVPKLTELPVLIPGLDELSAAILTLHSISRTVNQQISWLYNIWYLELVEARVRALELIMKKLVDESDNAMETALEEAERIINQVFSQEQNKDRISSKDPYLARIDEWKKISRNKRRSLKDRKEELETIVFEEIAIIKGFSTRLEKEIDVQGGALTHWPILALRADGPLAYSHEALLRNLRNEFNILNYSPLFGLCSILSNTEDPNRPIADDLRQVSDIDGRTAFYVVKELETLLVEQYLPTFRKLGLRYRYIFTPRQRPGVLSDGLIQRMILAEQNIRGCTVHIEPNWSKGPNLRSYEKGTYEAVVEEEILSLNLELFDRKLGKWSSKSHLGSNVKKKSRDLISRSTATSNDDPVDLTKRQLELLTLLWSIPMSRTQRKWFLEKVTFPQRTANRMLRQMIMNQTLRMVHLPALELVGLSDGFIAVSHCYDRRSRDKLVHSMQNILPFARILIGDSNHIVAHARVPAKQTDIVGGILGDVMTELSTHSFIARQRATKAYRMTALNKLRDTKTKKWKDPWYLSF